MQEIEFIYDFGSPNAYLVHKVLPGLASRANASLRYCPVLLGGIFKATGNQSPIYAFSDVTHKLDYMHREMARFVNRHGLQFQMNPHFPVMTIGVMRGAVYAQGKDWEARYIDTVFDAVWVAGEKMDDPSVIARVLAAADLPADEIMQATQEPAVKTALIDKTSAAVDRGTFGAPTMFAAGDMFFGKDALPDLEYALNAR